MGYIPRPPTRTENADTRAYDEWRNSPIGAGGTYEQYQQWLNAVPGSQLPTPRAPPPSIPNPSAGPPTYAPPQVQMPAMLPNPQPQGLGGMPLIRDRMMSATMSPFAGPNWGVPQVNPTYLTQQVPLPGGATPADAMVQTMPAGAPAQQPVGLGGMRIPRRIPIGLGTK